MASKRPPRNNTPIPWLVSERDFRRYLGRAVNACMRGRVVFFYHRNRETQQRALLALVPYSDWEHRLAIARASIDAGRVRVVRLGKDSPAHVTGRKAISFAVALPHSGYASIEYGMTPSEVAAAGRRLRRSAKDARRSGAVREVSGINSLQE